MLNGDPAAMAAMFAMQNAFAQAHPTVATVREVSYNLTIVLENNILFILVILCRLTLQSMGLMKVTSILHLSL